MNRKKWYEKLGVLLLGLLIALTDMTSSGYGAKKQLTAVYLKQCDSEYQVRFVCSGTVRIGSIWVTNPYRLIIYIRDAVLAIQQKEFYPEEGPIRRLRIGMLTEDPPIVRAVLRFDQPEKYLVENEGNVVVAKIACEKEKTSTRSEKGKMVWDSTGRISLDYRKVELADVLRLLSRQNNVNIVAGPDVKDTVTVSLRNVTLKEALDNILLASGYDYVVDGNVIMVKPLEKEIPGATQTKVYHLKYIDATNLLHVIRDVISDKALVKVFQADFYSRGDEGGKVQPRGGEQQNLRRSSTLIVTDNAENIQRIDQLVQQLDVPVPQIMIESKLVELAPIDQDRLGIDWDKTINATLLFEDILPSGAKKMYSILNTDLKGRGQWRFGHLTADEFSAALEFLRQNTDSKLISNPRILGMDNQPCQISVGTTFPVPQINRGLAGQGDIVTFQYKDVNIQLNVTPHVVEGKKIIMHVNPVIEEVTGEVVVDINRAPITSKRTVSTVVTVKDGETIVIGGMIKEKKVTVVNKVWLLGDIPLLGMLFRHREVEKKQTDLIIFITPHILTE